MRNVLGGAFAALSIALISSSVPATAQTSMSGHMMMMPKCSANSGPVVWYVTSTKTYYAKGSSMYGKGSGKYVCKSTAASMKGSMMGGNSMMHGSSMSHSTMMASPHPMSSGSMSGGMMASPRPHPMMSSGAMNQSTGPGSTNTATSAPVAPGAANQGGNGNSAMTPQNPAATPQPQRTP